MVEISKDVIESWNIFLKGHQKANMFQSPEMYYIYKESSKYEPYVVFNFDDNNNVNGVLLGVLMKESKNIIGSFTSRLIVTGGPLVKNNDIHIASKLIKKISIISKQRAIYCEFRNIFDISELNLAFIENGYEYESHYDIHMDLTVGEEEIFNRINKSKRKGIRKALKNEIEFKIIDNYNSEVEKSYLLIQNLYRKLRMPLFDKQLLISSFDKKNDNFKTLAFSLYYQENLIVTRIVYCYKKLIYGWYTASDEEYRNLRPTDLLPYLTMVWGAENGYHTFDFGGAGKPGVPYGVRDYKLSFGGDLIELGRYKKVFNPLLYKGIELGLKIIKKGK